MKDVAIVAYGRTGIAKAVRGALNQTHGIAMMSHVLKSVVARTSVETSEVEDVIIGCGLPEGATGHNIARTSALAADFPASVPGITVHRYCGSGVNAVSFGANKIATGEAQVIVAGGVESISLTQSNLNLNHFFYEPLQQRMPEVWWSMNQTADFVAKKYPDNRRPVDYDALGRQLADVEHLDPAALAAAFAAPDADTAKLCVTWRMLQLRKRFPELFAFGDYEPLNVTGAQKDQVLAFVRRRGVTAIVVVLAKWLALLMRGERALPIGSAWTNTQIEWPQNPGGRFTDVFTGASIEATAQLPVNQLFATLPIAVLVGSANENVAPLPNFQTTIMNHLVCPKLSLIYIKILWED